jgi:hypothetical protein
VIETLALGFWRFLEIESYFLERENDGGEVLCVIGFFVGRWGVVWCLSFFFFLCLNKATMNGGVSKGVNLRSSVMLCKEV